MKGIILHGGHGTRLRPLTHTGPKQLLPIANKPMSEYCLESFRIAGITEIAIVIGGVGANKVHDYYESGEKFNVKITYIEQDSPKGIAHAIGLCKNFIGNEKFLVFLGDNIIQKDINDYVTKFKNSTSDAQLLLCEVDNPSQFGIAEIENGKLKKITEKPKTPPTNLAVTGIYFLSPLIFDIIEKLEPSWRNELEIADALQMLIQNGKKIDYDIITDFWKDTGTPEDILLANKTILEKITSTIDGKIENQDYISGNILLGKNSIIKKDVKITGPVVIGKNCVIEDNARIGPYTSIGDNSHLSKCNIENTIVMSNCIVKSNIIIRNSIISYNSSILHQDGKNKEMIFLLGEGTKIIF